MVLLIYQKQSDPLNVVQTQTKNVGEKVDAFVTSRSQLHNREYVTKTHGTDMPSQTVQWKPTTLATLSVTQKEREQGSYPL